MLILLNDLLNDLAGKPFTWYLSVSRLLVCFGLIIDSCEHIINFRHFGEHGLFAGRVFRTAYHGSNHAGVRRIRAWLCTNRGFASIIGIRLLALLLVILPGQGNLSYASLLLIVLIIETLLVSRCSYGRDGSDQMDQVVLAGLVVSYLLAPRLSASLGLWFIALQCVLSYVASGVAKVVSPIWRSGDAFFRIFNTYAYGARSLSGVVLNSPIIGVVLCWTIIIFECLFAFALFMPPSFVFVLVVIGLLFHLFNAAVMGLNKFLWSWTATYPALLFCSHQMAKFLHF